MPKIRHEEIESIIEESNEMLNTPINQEYRVRKRNQIGKKIDYSQKEDDSNIIIDTVDLSLFRSSGHLNDIKIQIGNTEGDGTLHSDQSLNNKDKENVLESMKEK